MNKNVFEKIGLSKGGMRVYDFGAVRLHAYQTNDPISDEVFVIEKAGEAVVIESPCFFDNIRELTDYLSDRKLHTAGILPAYHMAGGTFLPDARKYATRNADEYGRRGGGRALIDQFAAAFGDSFDPSLHTITDFIEAGPVTIGGIDFQITPTADAFDIELPEINTVYTHMLGHDCHSIVAGAAHADMLIRQLNGYRDRGFSLILTSHYTPEDLKDVEEKIAYLEELKAIASRCADAAAFKAAVKERYPAYSGDNYLDMTVGFFFA